MSPKMHKNTGSAILAGVFFAAICLILPTKAHSALEEEINLYFEEMISGFKEIAESKDAKSSNLRKSKNYLYKKMKKNQVYYSLIRTNSKGVVINELIRGGETTKKFRNIAGQKSFKHVSRKKTTYYGFLKSSKTGRYYMLWATPYFVKGKKFGGVLLAKVDIWDTFYKYSEFTDVHFLVKVKSKSLFSHKWTKTKKDFVEKELNIPGVKNLTVRYGSENQETVAAAEGSGGSAGKTDEAAKTEGSGKDNPNEKAIEVNKVSQTDGQPAAVSKKKDKPFPTFIIGIIVILGVGLGLGILMAMQSKREKESIL